MGLFGFLKKKKGIEEPEDFEKPSGLEPPAFERPPSEAPSPPPFGAGITEPSFPEEHPRTAMRSFERESLQPSVPQPAQGDMQLVLSKLETIKAQLDFLQQKFERLEQQLNKEDVIKWR